MRATMAARPDSTGVRAAAPASRPHTARRVADIQPFEVMEVMSRAHALEAAGRSVVHMEIGEPDFTAPLPVVEAGAAAMRGGLTAYTPALGLGALRETIAGYYASRFGQRVEPGRIAVTAGASGGLLLALAQLVDPGDELLVPDPGYPGYRHFVRTFEGVVRPLNVSAASAFQPTLETVRGAWGARTTGLLLGSPANPTGTLIDDLELRRIAEFVAARGGVLIVDEIYQGLVYERQPRTALELPGDVIVVNSFSKYFCMTGWRLGWVVLPEHRVRGLETLAQHLFICPSAVAQHAALAAFLPETLDVLEARRREFARRRDFLMPRLERARLRVPAPPGGAFYLYASCAAFSDDARGFALALLEEAAVAATPGIDFGTNDTHHYIRFAYTRGLDELGTAIERIERFCARR
ncbi:MAG TPA: pyridoxal phosphate-dependent aminotransferase [Burkholderiales bacterium]|nr:pyridoxal phosphate-dependent aminotransferase [Burkholderiales bacterium]